MKLRAVLLCAAAVVLPTLAAQGSSAREAVSSGTGFVVDPNGYILTNEHVVRTATRVDVTVGDRRYEAAVVATAPESDLALLKIDASGLSSLPMSTGNDVSLADEVYAFGCPAGVCGTLTVGRVANLGVSTRVSTERVLSGLIMLDITITHGSSGGPLLNNRGEVVGVTFAGIVVQNEVTGFGLAIPVGPALSLLRSRLGASWAGMQSEGAALPVTELLHRVAPAVVYVESTEIVPLMSFLPTVLDGWTIVQRGDLSCDFMEHAFISHSSALFGCEGAAGIMASKAQEAKAWLYVAECWTPEKAKELADSLGEASGHSIHENWPPPWGDGSGKYGGGWGGCGSSGENGDSAVSFGYTTQFYQAGNVEASITGTASFSIGNLAFFVSMKLWRACPVQSQLFDAYACSIDSSGQYIIEHTRAGKTTQIRTGLYFDAFSSAFSTLIGRAISSATAALP
jgi:S1-C subfamily serine protease